MNTKSKYTLHHLEKDFGSLTFGRLLRSHRLGEEISQVAMAKTLRISKQSLNDLESGRTLPSVGRAAAIAKKLNLFQGTLVELAIQDQLDREKLNLKVRISESKSKRAA